MTLNNIKSTLVNDIMYILLYLLIILQGFYNWFFSAKGFQCVIAIDPSGNQRFACTVCREKMYKYRHDLVRHQRYECGKEPQFQCLFCPYKAKQKSTLKTHMALKHSPK